MVSSIENINFMKSMGFPQLKIHHSFNHFDFSKPGRRILVIGPMGSGKTEYSSRVWRDSLVIRKKSALAASRTTSFGSDRRNVFFVRTMLDKKRFPDYPEDALAYRGGYERCGDNIAVIGDSFDLEELIRKNPECGTWIIDEATFYDERLAYVIRRESEERGLVFIFPTLILNFRKDIFNSTAQLLFENSTDLFPLTAYCEHPDCMIDSFYTYRYYTINGDECPALYFDPLIVIGGDKEGKGSTEPNYCTRCDDHHFLPGKEYSYLILKPLGQKAGEGDIEPLQEELLNIKDSIKKSKLFKLFHKKYIDDRDGDVINMNALSVEYIAEKALMYLFAEQNLITEEQMKDISCRLELNKSYMQNCLGDNGRKVSLVDEDEFCR